MTRQRYLFFLVLLTTGIAVAVLSVVMTSKRSSDSTVFAFAVQSQVDHTIRTGVAKNGKIIGWLPAGHEQVAPGGQYVLSEAIIGTPEPRPIGLSATTIYAFDVAHKKLTSLRLKTNPSHSNCGPQISADGSLYVMNPNLVRYQMPGFTHPQPVHADLLTRESEDSICPLGTIGNGVLTATRAGLYHDHSPYWKLCVFSSRGETQWLSGEPIWPNDDMVDYGGGSEVEPVAFAATTRDASGLPGIAFLGEESNDPGAVVIGVLDPRTKDVNFTSFANLRDLDAIAGPSLSPLTVRVQDFWWGQDGKLYAILGSWGGRNDKGTDPTAAPSLWRLEGTQWVNVDGGALVSARQLDTSHRLIIVPDDIDSYLSHGDDAGTLYLVGEGSTQKIYSHVISIAVPQIEKPQPTVSLTGFPQYIPYAGP